VIKGITASCFDLLHSGHVAMLEECKENCDYLIACLQTDPTIDRPEKNKPIQTVVERYIQLRGLGCVDEIIPYETEQDLTDILTIIKPSVRFVGEEYRDKDFTGKHLIPLHYNSRQHRFSTSELRWRVYDKERLS
jgi:glycerol-3-phosphate cytidylyltransferase